MRREAGLLLHPTSLPGPYGIGDFGAATTRFLDWSRSAGQSLWQILPLGPIAFANSPYACVSAYAGNPLFVPPDRLRDEGLLPPDAIRDLPSFPSGRVDYDGVIPWKDSLLRASWAHVRARGPAWVPEAIERFRSAPEQDGWLSDWSLYIAVKGAHEGADWTKWEPSLRRRDPSALAKAAVALRDETDYQAYLQWLFFRYWEEARAAARERGISIVGDAPIYVTMDSVDVWANPELFQLDDSLHPIDVSGVPPDYFSKTGQRWGSPLYRWDRMEADGFQWWIRRIRAELRKCDVLRIDHFRAFEAYWAIPAAEKTAVRGRWEPGPGIRLFRALREALGQLPLIAEDLGEIDDGVRGLLRETGLPGMRVLQFGLADPTSTHHPSKHVENSVAYTGTHDNDTARGWFASLAKAEREAVLRSLGGVDGREVEWDMIRAAYGSPAVRAIVPIQDVLGLGSEARTNTPSKTTGNWEFRMAPDALTRELAARLRGLAETSGRG